jgi:hypothetical protein
MKEKITEKAKLRNKKRRKTKQGKRKRTQKTERSMIIYSKTASKPKA